MDRLFFCDVRICVFLLYHFLIYIYSLNEYRICFLFSLNHFLVSLLSCFISFLFCWYFFIEREIGQEKFGGAKFRSTSVFFSVCDYEC